MKYYFSNPDNCSKETGISNIARVSFMVNFPLLGNIMVFNEKLKKGRSFPDNTIKAPFSKAGDE